MIGHAFTPTLVEVVVLSDGRPTRVSGLIRPPTAIEGVRVTESAAGAASGDEDAIHEIKHVVSGWLPLRLASLLTSRRIAAQDLVRITTTMLMQGVPAAIRGQAKEAEEEAKRRARAVGWDAVCRDYRAHLGGSLSDPWPMFVQQVATLDEYHARAQLSFMAAYLACKSDKPAARNDILRRAGLRESIADMTDEEKQARAKEGWAKLLRSAGVSGRA